MSLIKLLPTMTASMAAAAASGSHTEEHYHDWHKNTFVIFESIFFAKQSRGALLRKVQTHSEIPRV